MEGSGQHDSVTFKDDYESDSFSLMEKLYKGYHSNKCADVAYYKCFYLVKLGPHVLIDSFRE